jgi:dUTP pyrophosphatase
MNEQVDNQTNEPLTIKVKYHTDIDPLQQISIGDAIDVRTAKDIHLLCMQYTKIPLGFSCKIPDGYTALLLPRSSTFEKYGIIMTNSVGIIDNSFAGPNDIWCMPVIALRTDVNIPKNTRIGQFIIIPKMPQVQFGTVDSLGYKNRSGFGSTGEV